jgi:UBX domain-containing protein 1
LNSAVTEYFASLDEGTAGGAMDEDEPEHEPEPYTGPRTLDGRPAPASIPSVGSSSKAPSKKKGGFATLGSLGQAGGAGGHAGHGHAHDEDDDSDDEDFEPGEEPRDLFAGGEKSGLAVQDPSNRDRNDPRKVVNDILKKARAYVHLSLPSDAYLQIPEMLRDQEEVNPRHLHHHLDSVAAA